MKSKLFESDILFTGYYGQLNTGDDAFVEVAAWGAKKYWNKNKNIFLAKKNTLPISNHEIQGYPLAIPKTYRLQNSLLLSSTKYLISAGGSTLHHELLKNDIKRIAVRNKIKGSGIKIGGIGVSIGPFKSIKDEKSVIEYLKNIDFLAVRDQSSFEYVRSINLPYEPINAFDLAALLPEIYNFKKKEKIPDNKKIVGVSVCPVESIANISQIKKENNREVKTNDLLKMLDKKENIHFKFFVINGHSIFGDLELTKRTIENVKPSSYEVVNYTGNTEKIWNEISRCDFVISTRLHAAIFSCFSDTPFILNEYHRKCSDFLDDINYDENFRVYDGDYDCEEKASKIINILNRQGCYILPNRVEEMKAKSILNFKGVII